MYYYLRSLSATTQHVVPATVNATVNANNISVPGRVCYTLSADRDSQTGSFQQFPDVSNDDLPVAESYLSEDEEISLSSSIAASERTSSGMELHSGMEQNDGSASQTQMLVTAVRCF